MSKNVVFVDLDETLIANVSPHSFNTHWYDTHRGNIFPFESDYIIRRPYCLEFLQQLNQLVEGNVYILTAGERKYQTKVCNLAGITSLVKGIYGAQDLKVPIAPGENPVLIDNDASLSLNTVHKLMKMGFYPYGDTIKEKDVSKVLRSVKEHVIEIKSFNPNVNDHLLLPTYTKVKNWCKYYSLKEKMSYSDRIRRYFNK